MYYGIELTQLQVVRFARLIFDRMQNEISGLRQYRRLDDLIGEGLIYEEVFRWRIEVFNLPWKIYDNFAELEMVVRQMIGTYYYHRANEREVKVEYVG